MVFKRQSNKKLNNFRYDISFLRVLAVLSVLFFHFNIHGFSGGFVGVDIFFVISGYLMSQIILKGIENNNFNILDFYKRRMIRIFPALLFMLIIFSLIVALVLPSQFFQFQNNAFSSTLFFSNIYYYLSSGYFDVASHYNFLLHTWSLSVEWQFYIIYPIFLLLTKRLYQSNLIIFKSIFIFATFLSFGTVLYFNLIGKNDFSFYMFITRAWEMMAGGLALLYQQSFQKISIKWKLFSVWISLLSLLLFVYLVNGYTVMWPSLLTIIPVTATGIIIALNQELSWYRSSIVTYFGNISYSLYLYHWPLFVLSHFLVLDIAFKHRLIFIAISFLLAVFSYELIEKNKLVKNFRFVAAISILIFVTTFCLAKYNDNININKDINLGKYVANYKFSNGAIAQYRMGKYHHLGDKPLPVTFKKDLFFPDNNKKNVLLIGDSHAGMFGRTMQDITDSLNLNLVQISSDATFPIKDAKSVFETPKVLFNYAYTDFIPANKDKINLVVLSANYLGYEDSLLDRYFNTTLAYFDKKKIPVLFIGQTRAYKLDYPTYQFLLHNYQIESQEDKDRIKRVVDKNEVLLDKLGNKYIDLLKVNTVPVSNQGEPYIYDHDHLTYFGTSQYKSLIMGKIESIIK